jgi:hypothetical protein
VNDPAPRPDGLCALPGCNQKVPKLARDHRDPFHASTCARTWHGHPLPPYKSGIDGWTQKRRQAAA